MRKAVTAILAALALAPAAAEAQETGGLEGNWAGIGVQTFPDGTTISFTTMVSFLPDGTVEIAYPSSACGGVLLPEAEDKKGTATFTEELTYGDDICAAGTVTLTPVDGALEYHWEDYGNGTAVGTLHRTGKAIPPHG